MADDLLLIKCIFIRPHVRGGVAHRFWKRLQYLKWFAVFSDPNS